MNLNVVSEAYDKVAASRHTWTKVANGQWKAVVDGYTVEVRYYGRKKANKYRIDGKEWQNIMLHGGNMNYVKRVALDKLEAGG